MPATPPTPYNDELRFKQLGDTTVDRYAAARAGLDDRRYAALAALRNRAAITGGAEDAYTSGAGAQWGTMADIADRRIEGDRGRVDAWWDLMPTVQYERLKGLGAAGMAEFDRARKKRAAAAAARANTGGGGGLAYAPTEPWNPWSAVEDAYKALTQYDTQPRSGNGRAPVM